MDIFRNKLNALQYIILPGKCPALSPYIELHNKAYLYWKKFWADVFDKENSLSADHFLRQDFIAILLHHHEIAAMHLYTMFPIFSLCVRDHSYFKVYPSSFFQYLETHHVKTVMSIEYLTVDLNWRKSMMGISLAEVMIGLSLKYLICLNIEAVIAPTRNDRKVNQMCYHFGFDCFQSGLQYEGFEIDLVAGFHDKVKEHSDRQIADIITHFWNNKMDASGKLGSHS